MPKRTRDDLMKSAQPVSALAARRLAQQQQQQQQTPQAPRPRGASPPATPIPKRLQASSLPIVTPHRHPASQQLQDDASAERERDEFRRKRQEIEDQLKTRNAEVKDRRNSGILGGTVSSLELSAAGGVAEEPKKKKKRTDVEETNMMQVDTAEIVAGDREQSPPKKKKKKEKKREESALERMKREKAEETDRRATLSDEDEEMRSAVVSESEQENGIEVDGTGTPRTQLVSSFAPTADNCAVDGQSSTFRMVGGETLVIVGVYQIVVSKGSVILNGAIITPATGPQTVYASTTHALPVIEALPYGSANFKKSQKSKSKSVEYEVELRITSNHSLIPDIGKLCPTYNNIWNIPTAPTSQFKELSFKPILSSTNNITAVDIPVAWKDTLDLLLASGSNSGSSEPARILVTGSKGTGKSTFSRIIANYFLTSTSSSSSSTVAYLDIDPGQPTFSPPGLLSLNILSSPILGPSFTTAHFPAIRSHHIGYTTPRNDPGHYVACISDLLETYRNRYPNIPLIINTAGWTKGLGLELLQDVLYTSGTTDIISLSSPHHQSPLAELAIPDSCKFHDLTSVAPKESRFSAADLRALQTMCYFHHTHTKTGSSWDFKKSLTGMSPWLVSYKGEDKGIDAVCVLGEQIPPALLATAVDATVVGIIVVQPEAFPDDDQLINETPYPPIVDSDLHPMPTVSECKGLAVIRALDLEKGEVQIITTIAVEEMERWEQEGLKVMLVRGRVELPVWEMVVRGREKEPVPWLEVGGKVGEGKGGAVWRVRRNVMRRGQQGGR